MNFKAAQEFIIKKLQNELSADLKYHGVEHTLSVLKAVEEIAHAENVSNEEDLILLKTAALFHDSGFTLNYKNHEAISCQIAIENLPRFNYSHEQIKRICGMIMATQIPQSPQNHLEEIIADADLDYLGTPDYTSVANKLYQELHQRAIITTEKKWLELQISFIEKHHYFTKTASTQREKEKQEHLNKLKDEYKQLTTASAHQSWSTAFRPKNLLLLLLGVICAVIAMKGFMIPNHFMDGGITGISILLHEVYHFNISILLIVFNLVFIYLSYKKISKAFAIQTSLAIVILSLCLQFIEVPVVTQDKLLIAVFGGFLIGLGMGLLSRAECVIDGFEILAVFTTRKTGFSISEIVLAFNSLIFIVAAYKLGIESAMYSIITYFAAAKTSDYVADGIEEYISLTIISAKHNEIKALLSKQFKKGISVYKGERGYLPNNFDFKEEVDIVVAIMTRMEITRIREAILELDDKAFMYINSIKEAKGGVLKRKSHH